MSHATSPGVQSCCEVFGSLFLSPGGSRDMLRVSAQSLFLVCAGHCLKRWEFISDEDPALAFQGVQCGNLGSEDLRVILGAQRRNL